jgi:hypothetical protein
MRSDVPPTLCREISTGQERSIEVVGDLAAKAIDSQ